MINLSQYSYTTLENDCQGEEVKIMQNLEEFEIKLYSTDDVCRLLHIGRQKCLQLFHQEDFPSIKIGRKFWIKADCLNEFLSHKRIMAK